VVNIFASISTLTGYFTSGVANIATKLNTPRSIQTNLASTASVNFDGTANITPGVSGTLPVGNGGTGATTFTSGQFLKGNGTGAVTTQALATVATSGSYNDLSNQPSIPTLPNMAFGTLTGATPSVTTNYNYTFTPSSNFTLSASGLSIGYIYYIKISTPATAYTFALASSVTNPRNLPLTLTASKITDVVGIATAANTLEIVSITTAP